MADTRDPLADDAEVDAIRVEIERRMECNCDLCKQQRILLSRLDAMRAKLSRLEAELSALREERRERPMSEPIPKGTGEFWLHVRLEYNGDGYGPFTRELGWLPMPTPKEADHG